jgi:hypothetical protein
MIKTMGVIFCHVNKIKQLDQFKPSITSGNQKWNGGIPIFVSNIKLKINLIVLFILYIIIEFFVKKISVINKIIEARACVKKYFRDLSIGNEFFFC